MQITRVTVTTLPENGPVVAYVNITLDDCFTIHGVQLIRAKKACSFRMPRTRRPNATLVNVALPLNSETRQMIVKAIVAEYEKVPGESLKRQP